MHEADGRVVSNLVVQALRDEPLTMFGDGQQTRSFCYVTDLIEGFLRLMESDLQATPVNLGNPRESTMLELARIIKEEVGSQAPLVFNPLPKDDPVRRKPDITRAREALGWGPAVPLERGIAETVADFRRRLGLEADVPARAAS